MRDHSRSLPVLKDDTGPPPSVRAKVLLVGFEDQDNLGLRYLSSRLREAGHAVRIVTIRGGGGPVLEAARALEPDVVGFSLIFQYLVPEYAELLAHLRAAGVAAHFTMGGHYASFEHEALLAAIPELDSVARFEGEDTLLELAERVAAGLAWDDVAGLALRDPGGGGVTTRTRPGRENLDELPWPDRDDIDYEGQYLPIASMLGSRGCPWKCSFCSIITFYEGNGTKGRRRRSPRDVVDELEYLHRRRGVQVILWQDDDFLAGGRAAVEWAHEIARESVARGLHHGLRWKLSCRSDEVRPNTLEPLVEAGLTHVYLGVEAGDPDDLKDLNKLLKPEVHLRAGEILRGLDLSFDFGFMLLQPWSTLGSVLNNVRFLREFAGDGAAVVGFCRMLPYVGTAAEKRLRDEGRLFNKDLYADYNFLDPRLDAFYAWLLDTFERRNFTVSGTQNLLRGLLFRTHLKLPGHPPDPVSREMVKCVTAVSNKLALDTVESAVTHIETLERVEPGDPVLEMLKRHHDAQDQLLRRDINNIVTQRSDVGELMHVTR